MSTAGDDACPDAPPLPNPPKDVNEHDTADIVGTSRIIIQQCQQSLKAERQNNQPVATAPAQ